MKHPIAIAWAVILAVLALGDGDALAQMRGSRLGMGSAGDVTPQIVVPPVVTGQPPVSLETIGKLGAVTIPPSPPIHTEAAPDGGDGVCRCPDGEKVDVEGWCWRPTQATTEVWAKAERCQP